MPKTLDVYLSPTGNDQHDGSRRLPMCSPHRAVAQLRRLRKQADQPVTGRVLFLPGSYTLNKPLVLDGRDAGSVEVDKRKGLALKPPAKTILAAAKPGSVTLSGGRAITGWKTTTVHGVKAWVASLPAVKAGRWNFTQLWVDGSRAPRPRLPDGGGLLRIHQRPNDQGTQSQDHQGRIFQPEDAFRFAPDEPFTSFHNISDVEFVALHFWIESRIPLKRVDLASRTAHLQHPTRMQLTDDFSSTPAPYYLDNVFEAFNQPGQWYLDRPEGKLYYIPKKGQTPARTTVIAPVLDHVLRIEGDPDGGKPARWIELHDLTFAHCEHVPSDDARQATPQAACHIPGAVQVLHAEQCAVRRCTVEHVGSYGIEVSGASRDCTIEHCTVHDTAAGGVRIFHATRDPKARGYERWKGKGPFHHPSDIRLTDCHLHDGGHRWRQAVGVLVGNCVGVQVLHNHVHDYDYTGISVGWTWGYRPSHTAGNIIEWNHIHDIGRGVLSDMGGIYTLGKQPGTRLRFNHIHDIDSRGYGGWGIYPDEGSCDMLIECNLVHDTKCDPFSQHFGKENIVRNNIFAFGRIEGMVGLSRIEHHVGFIFERNIVITDGVPITRKPYNGSDPAEYIRLDHNLYFDVQHRKLDFNGKSFAQWRKLGQDQHSLLADPRCRNLARRDFTLKPDSPAIRKLGFVPFDLKAVGPRPASP